MWLMSHWKIKDDEIERFSSKYTNTTKWKKSPDFRNQKYKNSQQIHFIKFYLYVIKNIEVRIELPVDVIKIEILLV